MERELPKIDRSNLWDQVYTILKDQIIQRKFKANQKLSIPELSEHLGISRTPIRDALNRLEMEGLVRTISKVGTFVTAVNVEDVLNQMDTRMMIDYWVIDQLPELPQEMLAKTVHSLEVLVDQADQHFNHQQTWGTFDSQFHLEFVMLGRNKKNVEIYRTMMTYTSFSVGSTWTTNEMYRKAYEQHKQILVALKKQDQAQLRQAVKEHINYGRNNFLEMIERNGGEM